MRYLKIIIRENQSWLKYSRKGLTVLEPIPFERRSEYWSPNQKPLVTAYTRLKTNIVAARRALKRRNDKLAAKEPNSVLALWARKLRRYANLAYEAKRPETLHKHVGVEIEFLSSWERLEIAHELAVAKLTPFVELKHDGSVSGDSDDCDGSCRDGCECLGDCNCDCTCGGQGHELAVVAKERDIFDVVQRVCAVLAKVDAYVNKTCGLHVHLDMRNLRRLPPVESAFHNLVYSLPLLTSIVPASRKKNHYCEVNRYPTMDRYNSRYYAINPMAYKEHKTLEVRLHSGTINAMKINNWIELLLKIARTYMIYPNYKSLQEYLELNRLDLRPELKGYVIARINEFKSQHGADSLPIETPELSAQENEVIANKIEELDDALYDDIVSRVGNTIVAAEPRIIEYSNMPAPESFPPSHNEMLDRLGEMWRAQYEQLSRVNLVDIETFNANRPMHGPHFAPLPYATNGSTDNE